MEEKWGYNAHFIVTLVVERQRGLQALKVTPFQ